jgi:hypothetical protein
VRDDGATIIATAGTVKRVSTATRVDDWDFTFPALPPRAFWNGVYPYDAVYGHFVIDLDFFTRIVYDGLK